MTADWLSIALAGVAGTLALTAVLLLAAALGLARLNFPMLLGSMFARPGPSALLIGLIWHLLNGLVFATLYSVAFQALGLAPDPPSGAAMGLAHALLAGLLLGLLGRVHPLTRAGHMPAPGAFGARYGARGVVMLLVAHLVYGAVLGLLL